MNQLNIAFAVIGCLVMMLALFAGFIKARILVLSEPLIAVLLGIAVGPATLDWLDPRSWGDILTILEQLARFSVAVAVMSIAVRLPDGFFHAHARAMAVLLGLGMVSMWLISGLLSFWILSVPFWSAMLIGAIVTPTDPVVSGAIVTGEIAERSIPEHVRNILAAESGVNDGGAYPYVFLSVLLLTSPVESALSDWITQSVLLGVVGAVALGIAIGYVAGRGQRWAHQKGYPEEVSTLTVTIGLSVTVLGAVKLLGSDGILAVFAAGIMFRRGTDRKLTSGAFGAQEGVNRLVSFPLFVIFGAVLPWDQWQKFGWPAVALAVAILLLRRLPLLLALAPLMSTPKGRRDAWFMGWFGPLGAAAIFYATLAVRETGQTAYWDICSLLIFASVVAHGATATLFTLRYGKSVENERLRTSNSELEPDS